MVRVSKLITSFLTIPAMLAWPAPQDQFSLQDDATPRSSGYNCTFQADPDAIISAQSRVRRAVFDRSQKLNRALTEARPNAATDSASTPIPHRNFIDDEIFNKLAAAKIAPSNLSTDEEFFRRINLDLTGRIPTSDEVRAFLSDSSSNKRDALIDKLLGSDAFNDKWTMWLGDLLQNTQTQVTAAVPRRVTGRNALYGYIYWAVAGSKCLRDIAYQAIATSGNNYDMPNGADNFIMGGSVTGGPAQDTYDGMLVRSATAFWGWRIMIA